jgi:hypothetical protein
MKATDNQQPQREATASGVSPCNKEGGFSILQFPKGGLLIDPTHYGTPEYTGLINIIKREREFQQYLDHFDMYRF